MARPDYLIAVAFAGILVAIAVPKILKPGSTTASMVVGYALLVVAAVLIGLVIHTWWRFYRKD